MSHLYRKCSVLSMPNFRLPQIQNFQYCCFEFKMMHFISDISPMMRKIHQVPNPGPTIRHTLPSISTMLKNDGCLLGTRKVKTQLCKLIMSKSGPCKWFIIRLTMMNKFHVWFKCTFYKRFHEKTNVGTHYTEHGNFVIFLSLKFYMKSFFYYFWSAKSAILTNFEALKFDFYAFLHFLTKFRAPKIVKAVFEFLDSLKLISRKIWMTEKSWNFHTVRYSLFHGISYYIT